MFRILSAISTEWAARLALRLFLTPVARRVTPEETAFLATARALQLQTPAGRVQTYEWLAPGHSLGNAAAPAVLVVHGWVSHTGRFADVIRALQARGLRVIACDAPAHGGSPGRQIDVLGYRSALNAVNAALGPAQGVLAHSFGAFTSAHWLADPETPPMQAAVLVGLPHDVAWLFGSFTAMLALQPATEARLRTLFRQRYGGDPEDFSMSGLAQHLHLPALLVHGSVDEFIPFVQATEVARLLSDGELVQVEGLGHSAPLRDAATVARMADFLAQKLRPQG